MRGGESYSAAKSSGAGASLAHLELQKGLVLSMPLSRPMKGVAAGVSELRIRDSSGAYRVFYYHRAQDRILVFHAFQKKAQKTPWKELELGRRRLKELLYA